MWPKVFIHQATGHSTSSIPFISHQEDLISHHFPSKAGSQTPLAGKIALFLTSRWENTTLSHQKDIIRWKIILHQPIIRSEISFYKDISP